MISVYKRDQGFTVIELLVVTLVILGLGYLMFNSMSDVRGRDRDSDRRADINMMYQQMEFYYDLGETSVYPTLAQLQDDTWLAANMKPLADTPDVLQDPHGRKIGTEGSDYKYEPTDCTDTGCAHYVLSADQEQSSPDPYVKNSVN